MRSIVLSQATTNNLKGVDLDVAPGTFLVVTGPSGAGKTSLAFGTLYAEGQRRYVESFSPYARQFLERLARPPVERLDPVPAAIAVDRRARVKTSRSTVGTLTELSDYVRALWVQFASTVCPDCGAEIHTVTPATVTETLLQRAAGERAVVTYAEPITGPEHYLTVRERLVRDGYRRVWLEGAARDLDGLAPSEVVREQAGECALRVVLDRLRVDAAERGRLVEAIETGFDRDPHQRVEVHRPDGDAAPLSFSRALVCDQCGYEARSPSPALFSFNSPVGACQGCRGFGQAMEVDWDKVMPDLNLSLADGAIKPWNGRSTEHERRILLRYCKREGIPTDVPLGSLSEAQRRGLVDGDGGSWRSGYPGLLRWFRWLETRAYKMHVRVLLSRYRKYVECPDCHGTRFKPESLHYRVAGRTIAEFLSQSAREALAFVEALLARPEAHRPGTARVLSECQARLQTLCDVGLSYVSLDRAARSLSGGELQRVGLTSALSASLSGTLFVLDEPTVGLHPSDVERLLPLVKRLSERDNVVVVVESDPRFVMAADRVVELGPGSGSEGGRVVFDGSPADLLAADTRTARALRDGGPRPSPAVFPGASDVLALEGCSGHNLKDVHLRVPLKRLVCVTGVSGSGKSSLFSETLVPALQRAHGDASAHPLPHRALTGAEAIDGVVLVDQAPLGRTSRGNPATYTGAWDVIRKRFARAPLSIEREYKAGFFSFNVPGGRCEACKGEGAETVEMQFLADVTFSCPECQGRRFAGPVLDVRVSGLSIADVLELTVAEAVERFADSSELSRALLPVVQVGLGYLRLGQPLSTLSGGEGQRLRIAEALSRKRAGHTLFLLDEPTAGLHVGDVAPLMAVLRQLSTAGDSVILIEHDMRVAAQCDHVIELGPGPGQDGGRVVVAGTPTEVAAHPRARTAPFLRRLLSGEPPHAAARKLDAPGDASVAVRVRGAREHNLQNVDVDIPREQLVVVTGPSGSGKSTLAFDVIFAESQRRYLETLSPYVRQYLRQLPRPEVDEVVGMPPGISLEQRAFAGAANSTVGTVTEVAHYLRVCFARAGVLHCPDCGVPIAPRPAAALVSDLRTRHVGARLTLLAPIIRGRRGAHRDRLARLRSEGFEQALIDGELTPLRPGLSLDRYKEHEVVVVVGACAADDADLQALVERALTLGDGSAQVRATKEGADETTDWLSTTRACAACGRGFPELDPRMFSFNTRQGGCPTCEGKGQVEVGRARKGRAAETRACPDCHGRRLAGLALHTRLGDRTIVDVMAMPVDAAERWLSQLGLDERQRAIAGKALEAARLRLAFLARVGLDYLTLDRGADSLSGGELQRVRLAAQLGAGLTGLLYVLDEPTIGLHPRDTGRLIAALRELVDRGCSVLVVEHDPDTILAADHMLDVGPSGGRGGGRVLASGRPRTLLSDPSSVTGASLSRRVPLPQRRPVDGDGQGFVTLSGARKHNLKGVSLSIPVGRLTCVTGVSGSGKSTLVREVFLPALRRALGLVADAPGPFDSLTGHAAVRRAVEIDQSPIGRTPRSVPATYVGVWDEMRKLLAGLPDARARGYCAARFSFNTKGGRCPDCEGQGATSVEMAFLPDALVPCETCRGLRFDDATLSITYRGLSAGQILQQEVAQAAELFAPVRKIHRPLRLLCDLGLGYLQLGQPSNTLSGGEAQRLKLVSELAATESSGTLYVIDEPTTGLHRDDVLRLLGVLQQLVDRGDTVLVIEHHTDVMAAADWLVDLGPEGGRGGGEIVVAGTPEAVCAHPHSHTGKALRPLLQG